MSRRKRASAGDSQRIKEVILREGDPFEEIIKIAKEVVRIPPGVDAKTLAEMRRDYKNRYDLVIDENGQEVFRTRQDIRLKVWTEACRYVYPSLKATENKTESDMKVTVVMKQFPVDIPKHVTVEDAKVVSLPEVVDVVVEKEPASGS